MPIVEPALTYLVSKSLIFLYVVKTHFTIHPVFEFNFNFELGLGVGSRVPIVESALT